MNANAKIAKTDREEQKKLRNELREIFVSENIWSKGNDRMIDFCVKSFARLVKLSDGSILGIEKPKIETRFCYGENDRGQGGDDPGTMAYAQKKVAYAFTEEGFMSNNLGDFDRMMVGNVGRKVLSREVLLDGDNKMTKSVFVSSTYYKTGSRICSLEYRNWWYNRSARPEGSRDLTESEIKDIRHAYMVVREEFKRRLRNWWKRNGANGIKAWTYWTEE